MLNVILEYHVTGPHALTHQVSAFIYTRENLCFQKNALICNKAYTTILSKEKMYNPRR